MENIELDVAGSLIELSHIRKTFHSEADFQFASAWQIQKEYPRANVRLEFCPADIEPTMHIDILVILDNYWYPIELKYKTLSCSMLSDGEKFKLKNHGAEDIGKYDFLKDVQRIETLRKVLPDFRKGYSVLLTNDPSYWNISYKTNTVFRDFNIGDRMIKTGKMQWASHAGAGTVSGRKKPIELEGNYQIEWQKYSHLNDTRAGTFKYIVLSDQ